MGDRPALIGAEERSMGTPGLQQRAALCLSQHQYAEAIALYRQCLEANPIDRSLYWHLGLAFLLNDQELEAQGTWLGVLVEGNPEQIDCWTTELLDVLVAVGRQRLGVGNLETAAAIYRQVLEFDAENLEAHLNLGYVRLQQKYVDEAIAHFRQAIALHPDSPDAHNNLGVALKDRGDLKQALQAYRQALSLDPSYYKACNNIGHVLADLGQIQAALVAYQQALDLLEAKVREQHHLPQGHPTRRAIQSDYAKTHSNLLFCRLYSSEYTLTSNLEAAHCWASLHAAFKHGSNGQQSSTGDEHRRLRIGYVSPDFRIHPVAYFIEPILAQHNRSAFEVFCYAQVHQPDTVTARLQNLADHWCRTVGMSDARLVEQIRADAIDILVDLAGHTAMGRLLVFAHKPAPVQVTYLGYPNTTGLPQMDYRFTDRWADPVGQGDRFYIEELIRLSACFLCYQPVENAPPVTSLPALDTGNVTFGSFNNVRKITPEVVVLWSQILRALPTAQIVLKHKSFSNAAAQIRYLELFAKYDISKHRIRFRGYQPQVQEHLALYNQVDIALDTFPYNGTTTTCEALWMGVPVITLAGNSHAGRVGVSLLSTVGLHDYIASTPEDYLARAVAFANNLQHLAKLRSQLRQQMAVSPLCNAPRFVQQLEAVYRRLWQRWCSDQPMNLG